MTVGSAFVQDERRNSGVKTQTFVQTSCVVLCKENHTTVIQQLWLTSTRRDLTETQIKTALEYI